MKSTAASTPRRLPTILVAEDESDQIRLLQREFHRQKFPAEAHFVRNGEEALDYLEGKGPYGNRRRFPLPDLVLLDLRMPKKDGFEVLKAMKSNPVFLRIPVVVLTVSAKIRDVNEAYQMGARTFMVKPLDFTELMQICKTLCPDD